MINNDIDISTPKNNKSYKNYKNYKNYKYVRVNRGKKNVTLIGFMGCGKTIIGKTLANRANYKFIDCDLEIQKENDMTIPHIFENYGEEHFRMLEKDFIAGLKKENRTIISTGGGAVKDIENIKNLKKHSTIIYLKAKPEKLYKNTMNDNNRPLLNTDDRLGTIITLLEQREPLYTASADIIIDVTRLEIMGAVNEIMRRLQIKGKYR